MTPNNIDLIWEDTNCQVEAGFVCIMSERKLFQDGKVPSELKISKVAWQWSHKPTGGVTSF
jgi:hypothetical protein